MTLFSFKDFGSNIIRSTANSSFSLSIKLKFRSQSKISYFDLHFIIQEQVSQLEIPVNNSMRVQILDRITNLHNIALNFNLVQSFSPSQKLIQRLTLAQFQNYINIFRIFKKMFKTYNIRVMKGSMDLDLTH